MLAKKWLFTFGVFLLGTPFLATHARNVEMVPVKTIYTKPIDVRVDKKGLLLTGKAWIKNATVEDVHTVTVKLIDNYNAEVWKEDIFWSPEFLVSDSRWTEQQILVPFSHDFAKESVSGNFDVVVLAKNKKNKLTAKGERKISLIKREHVTKISDLQITKNGEVKLAFSAFNEGGDPQKMSPEVSVRVQPQIDVFEHVSGGRLIYSEKGTPIEFKANESKEIHFKIPKPDQPESYVIEVQLFDEDGEPLTGILRKRLLVDGDFAEISSLTFEPERFLETGESVTFSFIGVARRSESPLTMKVTSKQKFRNKVINKGTKEKEITAFDFAEFKESFTFPIVEPGASRFEVDVELVRDGKVIEEKTFTTTQFLKYDTPAYQVYDTVMTYKWLMWLVVLVIVAGLSFLIWKLRRRSKIFNLLFLGIMSWSLFSGVGYADFWNQWDHPTENSNYNPQSKEGFEFMRFEGDIYTEPDYYPFFAYPQHPNGELAEPTVVNIRFLQGEEVRPLNNKDGVIANFAEDIEFSEDFLFEENIQIGEDRSSYLFEFPIPEYTFGEYDDGEWTPQIYFEVPMGDEDPIGAYVTFTNEDEELLTINIDTTIPELTFTYDPPAEDGLTSGEVNVTVTCDDGEIGSGCFPIDLDPFAVKGNFGEGFLGNNGFEICDRVKNCTDFTETQLLIDYYDPVGPSFDGVTLKQTDGEITRYGGGEPEANPLSSSASFTFTITDPEDPSEIEFDPELFDDNACGPIDEGNNVYLQQPVILSWTSREEDPDFTGFEVERREDEGEWISLTNQLESQALEPIGSYETYSFVDYAISEATDFEYRLKSHSSEGSSDPIKITEQIENFDLGDIEVSIFSATASNKRCSSKRVSCARNTIDREGETNHYEGGICAFHELPGDGEQEGACSDGGLFPLCFPFNLFSSGDTLPFTLPFILSGD
ncbi:hypothetical protein K9M41_04525 [Candidatus Gracilibacteria bacterium]|nr:hypothetical protein [Candidatus Gracilibacteria bacterium]